MRDTKGFTLIEMVVVLAVVAILAAILTPTIAQNISDAKVSRATNETQVVAAAMASFFKDVGRWPTKEDDTSTADYYQVLYGDGTDMAAGGNTEPWSSAGVTTYANKDTFANHLARNTPGGATVAANMYATTGDYRWKGPYITHVKADPWGSIYSCNVVSLYTTSNNFAVYVLSAGPDRIGDTLHNQDITSTTAPVVLNDDVGFRMR